MEFIFEAVQTMLSMVEALKRMAHLWIVKHLSVYGSKWHERGWWQSWGEVVKDYDK